jgi:predicted negative regulator of RcsB-dependent stress response
LYYLPHDISRLLTEISPEQRDTEIEETIHDLAPLIAVKRNEYRHFGPYWWWVKPVLGRSPGARRSWIRGGYTDRQYLDTVDRHMLSHPAMDDPERWTVWLGLHYYRTETVDDTPAGFHIVQTGHRSATSYTVYDADASEQLDLFPGDESSHSGLAAFLADPTRYTGSAWLPRAEEYIAAGQPFHGAAALRRAIHRAVDGGDRARAWIRLGQLFQELDHVHKALFCYHNAYQKDEEAWIQGLMADAWMQADEPQEALQCFHAALQAMPGNPEYHAGCERAQRMVAEHGRVAAGYQLRPERLAR